MAETSRITEPEIAAEHAAESHAHYLVVWAWLAFLTAVEYVYAYVFQEIVIVPFLVLLLGLLLWAAIKAGLVGWFFMHLKFEGAWVYILLIPAAVLATILVLALTPDMVFKPETEENPEEGAVWVAPDTVQPFFRSSPALAAYFPRESADGRSRP